MSNIDPIKKVIIVGGGTAGWMAAAVLSEQFKGLLEIELIERGPGRAVELGEATIPQFSQFTDLLGIDDAAFLKRTSGTFKLGTRYSDWGAIGNEYMHAYGPVGMRLGLLDFHHYWLKARAAGQADSLDRYSLNASAALARRFSQIDIIPDTHLEGLVHACHFDAQLLAAYLEEYSEKRGVRHRPGSVVEITQDSVTGFIESLTLESGKEVFGDLFIDCTGFRGLLIEDALETGYEDWSLWLPCDRVIAVSTEPQGPLLPYTRSQALDAGWKWEIPLQNRTSHGHVYSSKYISDDEALSVLLGHLGGEALAEPKLMSLKTGLRRKLWNRNCVALGRAGCFLEPLESISLQLVHTVINRLLEYFPRRGFDKADTDEFNRRCTWEFERIRDFLILHYHINQRTDSRFWIDRRNLPVPAELQRRTDLFAANGRIHREFDELFTEAAWLQVMVGQGIMPAGWHPLADRIDEGQMGRFLSSIQTIIDGTVGKLPRHEDYIRKHCAAD